MRIYISTPVVSCERDEKAVRARIEALTKRLAAKGYEAVSHLDCAVNGKWADKVGGNLALLLGSDGILLDCKRKSCRVCAIEESVSVEIRKYNKGFLSLHTAEEYEYIRGSFVV